MIDLDNMASREWWRAMQFFDDGDPSILSALIVEGEPMTLEVRRYVAEIVSGARACPTQGKATKLLNHDHIARLNGLASTLFSMKDSPYSKTVQRDLKATILRQVARDSGATPASVAQTFKRINSKWVSIERSNKTVSAKRIRLKKLRTLSLTNDPFGRAR
jgi:hypothetical protein